MSNSKNIALKKKLKDETGAIFIEMVISVITLMSILVLIIDLLNYGYANITNEYIMSQGLRSAAISNFPKSTNCTIDDIFLNATEEAQGLAKLACIRSELIAIAASHGIEITADNIIVTSTDKDLNSRIKVQDSDGDGINDYNSCTNPKTYNEVEYPGAEKEYVSICLKRTIPLFLGMNVELKAFGISRNEPVEK